MCTLLHYVHVYVEAWAICSSIAHTAARVDKRSIVSAIMAFVCSRQNTCHWWCDVYKHVLKRNAGEYDS